MWIKVCEIAYNYSHDSDNAKHKEMVKICESLADMEKCLRRDKKEICMSQCLYNLYGGNRVR